MVIIDKSLHTAHDPAPVRSVMRDDDVPDGFQRT